MIISIKTLMLSNSFNSTDFKTPQYFFVLRKDYIFLTYDFLLPSGINSITPV